MVSNKKTDKKNPIALTAGAAVAVVAIGAGGYGLGMARTDGLRDAPENYSISEQERETLDKTISSLKLRKSDDDIPEYNRSSLPTNWRDLDGNGCNTRYDILVSNFRKYARYNNETCDIKSGTIFDYYNGKLLKYDTEIDSGGGIQIDHIVSIGNAWVSGGYKWAENEWITYINDESVLIPTASSTNRDKSDKDITEWQPANTDFLCAYVAKQTEIKKKYSLTITPQEKTKFQEVLKNNCVIDKNPNS